MPRIINLENRISININPRPPFNFDGTVHNPGHYPTPTEDYVKGKFWQTFRFGNKVYGIKLENRGSVNKPLVRASIFSTAKPDKLKIQKILKELSYRFEFERDISGFCSKFQKDVILGPVLKRWRGMRIKCGYSVFESLMIYVLLQNATVRRTAQMTETMLKKYGSKVRFDGKELYVFWSPNKIHGASEEELRSLKIGYRAKFIKRISESFVNKRFDEAKLRTLDNEQLKKELLKLYGIGPQSVWYLMFEVFHRYDAFEHVPPWEQKIYSHLLFNKALVPPKKILTEAEKRWGEWKMLASFYIFTNIFWERKRKKIDWLEKEIRL